MKSLLIAFRSAFWLVLTSMTLILSACQPDSEKDVEVIQDQWENQTNNPMVNHGKVVIKLEPHGSVRAKVFQGKIPVYEFILDREKQQNLLIGSIENADVYLTGEQRDGLVIDDLQRRKRYVLSFYDITPRLRNIPAVHYETVFIKGYAVGLAPLTQSIAFN